MDHRTSKGRDLIDRSVLKALKKKGISRGSVADAVGVDVTVASASLKRLVNAGRAVVVGERGQARYSKA